MQIPELTSFNLSGQRVLIREDLNVPVSQGKVSSDARIQAALPTLRYALDQGAKVIVMSHLGRPREGVPVAETNLDSHIFKVLFQMDIIKAFQK